MKFGALVLAQLMVAAPSAMAFTASPINSVQVASTTTSSATQLQVAADIVGESSETKPRKTREVCSAMSGT